MLAAQGHRKFAQVLEELIAEANGERRDIGSTPSLQVDLFEQIERLQSENREIFALARKEFEAQEELAPEARDFLERLMPDLPIEPEAISAELALDSCRSRTELDALRRRFAFDNHPDRMAPYLRERAETRMRVANALIDAARRRIPA